eukprot:CAMPEP_0194324616 /NCGR_PEP_ID=MMETSP0171-20130528/28761_1 /TAXON_ID=218684 /ORGANISM="Corethron pennatum, Strain L29A3" /LENGTH=326 /DNA_ID=CAMNT_0039083561 /DNA_START=185 /DNA_END=1165 /DNA_ORIENTATION=-
MRRSTSIGAASEGDVVTVDYSLSLPKSIDANEEAVPDDLFDRGEVSFVVGMGNYLPGLHETVRGMSPGESITGAKTEAGFGPRDEENLVIKIPPEDLPEEMKDVQVGSKLFLQGGVRCTVVALSEDGGFTIDANNFLAGKYYNLDVSLREVTKPSLSGSSYSDRHQMATFGLGCFWGGELAFMRKQGVVGTKVGYSQGRKETPTYEEVCAGTTGHTEALRVIFDPAVITYEELCRKAVAKLGSSVYLLNQVGADQGTQYRSGFYYHDDSQREVAAAVLAELGPDCKVELEPAADTFWDAESYHQQYLFRGGQSAKKDAEEVIRCYG